MGERMGDDIRNVIEGGTYHGPVLQGREVQYHHHHHAAVKTRAPRQLAPEPDVFVDRHPVFAELERAAAERTVRSTPLIVTLTGLGGMGKTATALRWLHRLRRHFPGGQLQADMSPHGPLAPLDPHSVLQGFVQELGTRADERPAGQAALEAHYRSLTARRPLLVLLDDVVNAGQVRPLLPAHPGSVVVVTSRMPLTALKVRHPSMLGLTLGSLDREASAELFRAVAGEDAVPDVTALESVLAACGGYPLAVRIAAARAGELYGLGEDPAELARELGDHRTRLEALAVDDLSVPQVLEAVHLSLADGPAALYRALGAHPTPEFSRDLVRRLAGNDTDARTLLRERVLEPAGEGRVRMHRLVHDHARSAGTAADEPAVDRLLEWYLRRAAAVERSVSDRWRYGPVFAEPEPEPEADSGVDSGVDSRFADAGEALDAFEPDRANAVAAARLAHDLGRYATAWQLAEALRGFFFRRKYHQDWIEVCELGLKAAGACGDDLALARTHYELAFAHADRGDATDAGTAGRHYREALRLASAAGHARTESSALEGLGLLALREGAAEEAAEHFRQAFRALDGLDHPRGRALLTFHLGRAHAAGRRHQEAAELLLRARRMFAELPGRPDRFNEAKSLWHHARARLRADRPDEALPGLDEAITLITGCGAPKEHADILLDRGDLLATRGGRAEAEADWQAALTLYEQAGSALAAKARERLA
ncbi:NB-ARC domain-containing protein [Streptomyces sp. NPDC037389]|uniref:NB-ARC domain-containing protein n=1 Tax=Streptomyces sp. NPDC037389 TaxID=3155369 RepID=UPI0033F553BA